MSSTFKRFGIIAGSIALLAVAVASGQDRKAGNPAERKSIDVFNPVEGRITVISSLPDGTRVSKGDLVCELDPSELRDRRTSLEIAIRGGEAGIQGARISREVAVMAVTEYKEGIFVQDLATVVGEIKQAESNLTHAEDALEWSRRMFDKGYVSMAARVSEELAFKKCSLHSSKP